MFPLCALCFISSLSWTPQLPSTLAYCTSLILLRSRSRIPLRRCIDPIFWRARVRAHLEFLPLVRASRILTIPLFSAFILVFHYPLASLTILDSASINPSILRRCHRAIFHVHFSLVFSTLSPPHSFTSFTFPLLFLLSCYRLVIRLMTFTNSYDLTTIPFVLVLFFIHALSFDEMRT